MTDYLIYDVFTDTTFGGNPLAVLPEAKDIPEDRLQSIAREFNFSETTFVYPPENPQNTARVRIFTPTVEVPFAGHPVIGTAVALADLGRGGKMVFELGVGPIPVSVIGNRAQFRTSHPLDRGATPDPAHVAACLDLSGNEIRIDRHAPQVAGVGLDFALCELTDRATLSKAMPVTDAFRDAAARYPSKLDFAVLAYVRDRDTVHARMFAPLDSIPEDPATGSAAAALTAFLAESEGKSLALTIHQGVDMGRPSLIETKVSVTDGRVTSVSVAGQAVRFADGTLHRS
jgi:trans-2,3-dihydro-3-hydroxyanthranilate isomerase